MQQTTVRATSGRCDFAPFLYLVDCCICAAVVVYLIGCFTKPRYFNIERLELEEVRTHQEDAITTTSRDRILLRDVPSVRQELDRVVCEVAGPSTAGHVAVLESSYEIASPTVVGTRFELDPHDIDWQALDRSLSLTEPRPAFVRIEIIPQR